MARPVPIAPCRSPFAASRPAPSCAPAPEQHHGGHTSPTPPSPSRRGWGCCVWGDKTARLLRKSAQLLRETCRLFAQLPFIVHRATHPADRHCHTRVHTAGDNPNGKPAKNTLFPTFPLPTARCPRKIGTLCKSFAKRAVSPAISRAKTSEKTAHRGFSTGLSRPKRVKNGLKIINRRCELCISSFFSLLGFLPVQPSRAEKLKISTFPHNFFDGANPKLTDISGTIPTN